MFKIFIASLYYLLWQLRKIGRYAENQVKFKIENINSRKKTKLFKNWNYFSMLFDSQVKNTYIIILFYWLYKIYSTLLGRWVRVYVS